MTDASIRFIVCIETLCGGSLSMRSIRRAMRLLPRLIRGRWMNKGPFTPNGHSRVSKLERFHDTPRRPGEAVPVNQVVSLCCRQR